MLKIREKKIFEVSPYFKMDCRSPIVDQTYPRMHNLLDNSSFQKICLHWRQVQYTENQSAQQGKVQKTGVRKHWEANMLERMLERLLRRAKTNLQLATLYCINVLNPLTALSTVSVPLLSAAVSISVMLLLMGVGQFRYLWCLKPVLLMGSVTQLMCKALVSGIHTYSCMEQSHLLLTWAVISFTAGLLSVILSEAWIVMKTRTFKLRCRTNCLVWLRKNVLG